MSMFHSRRLPSVNRIHSAILLITLASSASYGSAALIFDGSDDYCEIAADSSLNLTSEITIEAWVKWAGNNGATSFQIILNQDFIAYEIAIGGNAETGHFLWYLDGVTVSAFPVSGGWYNAGAIRVNRWTHVAVAYDGSEVRTYIDGEETGAISAFGNIAVRNNHVRVGARGVGAPGGFFNGAIDEVRLWNVGRTSLEIEDNMDRALTGGETGLVLHLSMEEGTGQVAADSSPLGNDARLGATVGTDPQDPIWGASEGISYSLSNRDWIVYE